MKLFGNQALDFALCAWLYLMPGLGMSEGSGCEQITLGEAGESPSSLHPLLVLQQVISSIIPNDEYFGFEPLRFQVSRTWLWKQEWSCHGALGRA